MLGTIFNASDVIVSYINYFTGNPIADTFAVVARKNSAILVLGDGVNWGSKAALGNFRS